MGEEEEKFEYVKYYGEHVQAHYKFESGVVVYDGLSPNAFIENYTKYSDELKTLGEKTFIEEKTLDGILGKMAIRQGLNVNIDAKKLWVFSLFLYQNIYSRYIALLKPTIIDEITMYSQLKNITSITFTGIDEKGNEKTATFEDQSFGEEIGSKVECFVQNILERIDNRVYREAQYEVDKVIPLIELKNKRLFNFYYMFGFERFLVSYFKEAKRRKGILSEAEQKFRAKNPDKTELFEERVSKLEQEMIVHIMYLLKCYDEKPNINAYKKMMSDFGEKRPPLELSMSIFKDEDGNELPIALNVMKWIDWQNFKKKL